MKCQYALTKDDRCASEAVVHLDIDPEEKALGGIDVCMLHVELVRENYKITGERPLPHSNWSKNI